MADLAKRQPTAIERVLSKNPDTRALQNLQYALYATQEQPKLELAAGTFATLVAVLLGYLLGTGGVSSAVTGLVTGLGTFFVIVAFIFCWHLIHAPGAFRDYWEAKAKEIPDTAAETLRRKFLAERLQTLLEESGKVDMLGSAAIGTMEGIDILMRQSGSHTRNLHFLQANYSPEIVERFQQEGTRVLEELLAQNLSGEETPKLSPAPYPKLEIDIKETMFDFVDDSRTGAQYGVCREPCFVTLLLRLKNTRPTSIAIGRFKLTLIVDGKEYVSFAEPKVSARRLVTSQGTEAFERTRSDNLNEHPPLVLLEESAPVEGTLQFMFNDLRYMDWLTEDVSLGNSPFTLLLIATDKERHTAEGLLPAEGVRYINP